MKKFKFINNQSKKEFLALPDKIQKRFANDLNAICQNKEPFSKFKHLKESVGIGAVELIENGRPAYRTIYVAKFADTVFILHSFTKTTNEVDKQAMDTAKKRYKLMQKKLNENISTLVYISLLIYSAYKLINKVFKMTLEYSNIFDAITEDKAEASELQTRSDLMIVIRDIINAKNWSQADAAAQLGLTQPRVSDLVNGRIEKFSIDKLMTCLYRIGFRFKPAFADNQLTMAVEAVTINK